MFRIYKRKGSPFYQCDISIPTEGGEPLRVRQSTKQKTKAAAMRAAAEMEKAVLGKAGADEDTSAAVLGVLEEAARLHARAALTLERGRELLGRMVQSSSGDEMVEWSIRKWFTTWLEGRAALVKPSTHATYRTHVRLLLDWLGEDADRRLETLSREKLTRFRDGLREGYRGIKKRTGKLNSKSPRKGRTVDFVLVSVSAALRLAVRDGILLGNPAAGVEPIGAGDSVERKPFTPAEVASLLDAAPTVEWRGLMSLAFWGGLRLMDAATLTLGSVDLAGGTITFVPRKTSRKGGKLTVPIHARLREALEALPRGIGEVTPVLPSIAATSRGQLCQDFAKIMDKAKVAREPAEKIKGARRTFYARGFHSFRHSLVSALAAEDVAPELRMKLLGHKSEAVHQGYTHLQMEALRTALEKIS